ncbi:BTAD domain-containing putative transcriptional regulator [Catenulispora yoronensis]|uniref:BTAD domain-containing putative transcriptional regulator n=1 Tax=Catenulispora yoronensis TaxID=450799 RepID=UPI00362D18AE
MVMTALDRDGRTEDALAIYRELRSRLRERTATEPHTELRSLPEDAQRLSTARARAARGRRGPVPCRHPGPCPDLPGRAPGRAVEPPGGRRLRPARRPRAAVFALDGLGRQRQDDTRPARLRGSKTLSRP